MPGRVWTREKLIETIQELAAQGVDLSPTAIQKTHSALFSSARSRSHFGNWRDAVEAAGLQYDDIKRIKQKWSRQEILAQIRRYHAEGHDLLNPTFKIKHRNLYLAACAHRYFGSWRRAIQAAGLDHETMRESRVWTKTRIQRTIQEMAKEQKPLGWAYVEEHCPGIYRAARRRENFGSWHNALIQSGIKPPAVQRGRRPNLTAEQIAASARIGADDLNTSSSAASKSNKSKSDATERMAMMNEDDKKSPAKTSRRNAR